MLKIGLTGGIACGKSYTLRQFKRLGAYTIDADELARELVRPGQPALGEIVEAFGESMLDPTGELNRRLLGDIIFGQPDHRQKLNEIVHPYILAEEQRRISQLEDLGPRKRSPLVVVDAALMIEVGSYVNYDKLIVVYCPRLLQEQRLMSRNGLDREEAVRRIESQMPALDKLKFADYVVDTSGELSETDRQVRQIYKQLLLLWEKHRTD